MSLFTRRSRAIRVALAGAALGLAVAGCTEPMPPGPTTTTASTTTTSSTTTTTINPSCDDYTPPLPSECFD